MKFRQKPPTKPGYYWALPTQSETLEMVLVGRNADGSLRVEDDDGGWDFSLSFYRLWSAEPIAPTAKPAFTMPKRWINYHKPEKVSLPASCRRWGHKWVWDGEACAAYNESVKPKPPYQPKDGEDKLFTVYAASVHDLHSTYGLTRGPDTFLKCSRCNEKNVYSQRLKDMWNNMFETDLYEPTSIAYDAVQDLIGKCVEMKNKDTNNYSVDD